MFDIHAHLCFPDFREDMEKVIADSRASLAGILVSSCRLDESREVLALARRHPGFLFASIGHHPIEGDSHEKTISLIRSQAGQITAIGEVGLDYHWEKDREKQEQQKRIFRTFVSLARQLGKPLVIHSWDAEEEAFQMVRDAGVAAAFHCYTGPRDLALEIAAAGFYVSISTAVFFSKTVKKTAKALPLDRLLLETDSPFLDPDRQRKHNTPPNILLAAQKIAELRGIAAHDVGRAALENAKRLFRLPL